MNRQRLFVVVVVCAVAAAASAAASAARGGKVYVGERSLDCGGGCLGPSSLLYKPRTLRLRMRQRTHAGPLQLEFIVTDLTWSGWGTPRAVGHGRALNPSVLPATVVLDKIRRAGCSSNSGRWRAYDRATLTTQPQGDEPPLRIAPLLAC